MQLTEIWSFSTAMMCFSKGFFRGIRATKETFWPKRNQRWHDVWWGQSSSLRKTWSSHVPGIKLPGIILHIRLHIIGYMLRSLLHAHAASFIPSMHFSCSTPGVHDRVAAAAALDVLATACVLSTLPSVWNSVQNMADSPPPTPPTLSDLPVFSGNVTTL